MRNLFLGAALVTLCPASAALSSAQSEPAAAARAQGPPTAAAKSVTILRSARTISNQPLKLPQGEAELVAAAVDIPSGGVTPIHQHPWSRFVYVEKGPLTVVNHDTGQTREFQTGVVLPEVVAQWHEGRALKGPVRVIVMDIVPPGATNMVMKPGQTM